MPLSAPLTFEPRFQNYLWGGRNLARLLGREIPDGIIAESWEISAHPAAPTSVDQGPLAGSSLAELVERFGTELVGSRGQWAVDRGVFPLLIKLLDAHQPLSVQVHPDDTYAAKHEGGELGKTEMWYILDAEPGAEIIYGLEDGTTREAFTSALAEGRVASLLHRLPVQAGDSVLIEAGTVHAVLEGIVLAEIQQSSNTTYRVFDWDRVDVHGNARALHIDQAMDVIDFGKREPGLWESQLVSDQDGVRIEVVSHCDKFRVERVTMCAGASFESACVGETFEAWGVLSGSAAIAAGRTTTALGAVRFALLPATMGPFEVRAQSELVALRACLPRSV